MLIGMRLLETTKIWTGDGLGQTSAVTLTQLKRTDKVALYQRTMKNGRPQGYEVFMVKVVEAGTPLPGGGVVAESYEQYPTANRFGKIAWAPSSLGHAEMIYANLVKGLKPCDVGEEADEDETPETPVVARAPGQRGRVKGERPQLTVPVMEFSCKELAESNKVEYPIASVFIKEAIESNTIKFVRSERRNVKGKPTNLYSKV
jgi:hypothetical protein